jgi:hypothetical protein
LAPEERAKVGNAPVIDVGIRAGQPPIPRVGLEGALHVLVNQFLKIDTEDSVAANHHIRAHTRTLGDIATRVSNADIGRIVLNDLPGPL